MLSRSNLSTMPFEGLDLSKGGCTKVKCENSNILVDLDGHLLIIEDCDCLAHGAEIVLEQELAIAETEFKMVKFQ